ncbi:disease resistance protein RPM1-like [Pistacia vera]|uniref:disease resistance protein RPM1-like n=1 Tax=Pistacia vera TaxID=55513 RepID=UPI001262FC10|nr:disease resistance protein RPM1-like [Pistacia vera]
MPNSFLTTLVVDFKLIKVLDFEDSPIKHLPERVGNLFRLHYLSVKNTKINALPKSLGKLLNLETLNLKCSLVTELPLEIKNLKKLRYLAAYSSSLNRNYEGDVKIHAGFSSLMELQRLILVEVDFKELKELTKLRQLRKLGIRLTNGNKKDLCACIGNLEKLVSLTILLTSREEILDIESISPPHGLQRLYLTGNMKKLPYWIFKLEYIVRIGLDLSGLTDDPMIVLQGLPNLLELRLCETCHGEQLHFKEGWFPKLKILLLVDFKEVELMIIDKGAKPNLEELLIGPYPRLKEIPIGIEHLRNLRILKFCLMLKEICYMIKDKKWKKVTQHIPEVRVTFKKEGELFHVTTKYFLSLSPVNFEQFIEKWV